MYQLHPVIVLWVLGTMMWHSVKADAVDCTKFPHFCAKLTHSFECRKSPQFMEKYCPGFCKSCQDQLDKLLSAEELESLVEITECKDEYDECTQWTKDGECPTETKINLAMQIQCRKSCDKCLKDDWMCHDQEKECEERQQKGECLSNIPYMVEHCAMTCQQCAKEFEVMPTQQELKDAREIALKWHNIFRKWHDAPPMELDDTLNEHAQQYAERLLKEDVGLYHDTKLLGQLHEGENIHMGDGEAAVTEAETAAKNWYFEFCDTEAWPRNNYSHFSQLVWTSSVKLGIGVARKKWKAYTVGRYTPTGNAMTKRDDGIWILKPTGRGKLICNEDKICDGNYPKNYEGVKPEDCFGPVTQPSRDID